MNNHKVRKLRVLVDSFENYEVKNDYIEQNIENIVPYFNFKILDEDIIMAGIKSKFKRTSQRIRIKDGKFGSVFDKLKATGNTF